MPLRFSLALLALVLCCAGSFLHAWQPRTGENPEREHAGVCGCSNPDCECVGVCDCARASCCASKHAPDAPAQAQPAPAPAPERLAEVRPARPDEAQDAARPRVRRSRCGSHEKPAVASSSGGAPAGLQARDEIPSTPRLRAAHPERAPESAPPSRRPAPPTPPPERV